MIPGGAKDAAFDALAAAMGYEPGLYRGKFGNALVLALEAAAPHMLAAAWDRALQDADDQGYLYEHQTELLKQRNPYRA